MGIVRHDNLMVKKSKNGVEFFAVRVGADEGTSAPAVIFRYCVPGRLDIYSFDWVPGSSGVAGRVRYFSDTSPSISYALEILKKDLNKVPVVKMLVDMCRASGMYCEMRTFVHELLAVLAPKSAAMRECVRCLDEIRNERRKLLKAQKINPHAPMSKVIES